MIIKYITKYKSIWNIFLLDILIISSPSFFLHFLSHFFSFYFSGKAIWLSLGTNMISLDIKDNASKLAKMKNLVNFSVPYFLFHLLYSLFSPTHWVLPGSQATCYWTFCPYNHSHPTWTIWLTLFPWRFHDSSDSNLHKLLLAPTSLYYSWYCIVHLQ